MLLPQLRLQDVLHNNSNRQELLLSVWRAFLSLAEHALKVTVLSATAAEAMMQMCKSVRCISSRGGCLSCCCVPSSHSAAVSYCCCCLQSTFKSDYLSLVDAAGTAMAELLCSKQALAEVRCLQEQHHVTEGSRCCVF
jgi:hypothetical protein